MVGSGPRTLVPSDNLGDLGSVLVYKYAARQPRASLGPQLLSGGQTVPTSSQPSWVTNVPVLIVLLGSCHS